MALGCVAKATVQRAVAGLMQRILDLPYGALCEARVENGTPMQEPATRG
jgi:hypothetical protein